ncbi:MAG TPA: DUF2259 domain-containing protein [Devosia sp.]|nr:DUF2259 domain-containing protein [Devosia sp.]
MFQIKKQIGAVFFVVMTLVMSVPATGAQNTQFNPIGYSEQGRYFAYEEFGTDADNRVAYAKIYLVDLVEITQVVGTPIFVEGDLTEQTLAQVRQNAAAQAGTVLQSLEIIKPATIVAMFGDGHYLEDKSSLTFGVPALEISKGDAQRKPLGKYQLSLKSFETATATNCIDFTQSPPMGFSLAIENFGASREIYVDKALPRSRQCPLAYEISAVVMPFGATDISQSVGIISVMAQGPTGLSRQFLAIPLAFDHRGRN